MAEVGRIQIEVDARQVEKATRALNDLGLKAQATGRKVDGYEKQTEQATKATNKMANSSRKLTRMFGLLSAGIGGLTFVGLARSIERSTTQLANIEATMQVAAGSSEAAGRQIAFIREESERLGLFFPTVAKQMAQFSAAARGTSIDSRELRTIFTGISEASRAMGLTAPEAEGAMKALQQMMSKGKVSAEELRQQLGERMPGSIQIMAASLDVTTQELFKMMEQGKLLSDEVLPKFGRELSDVFSAQARLQSAKIAASIQRLQTAFFDLMAQGNLFGAARAIDALADTITDPTFQKDFDTVIQKLANFAGMVGENIDKIITLTKILGVVGIASFTRKVFGAVGALFNMSNAAKASTVVVSGLAAKMTFLSRGLSFLGGPAGIIAGIASSLFLFSDRSDTARESTERWSEELGYLADQMQRVRMEGIAKRLDELRPNLDAYINKVHAVAEAERILRVRRERGASQEVLEGTQERIDILQSEADSMRFLVRAYGIEQKELDVILEQLRERRDLGQETLDNQREQAEALEELKENSQDLIEQLFPERRAFREYLDGLDLVNSALAEEILTAREAAMAREELNRRFQEETSPDFGNASDEVDDLERQFLTLEAPMSKVERDAKDIADAIRGDLSNSITDVIMDVESLSDAFASLAEQIARTIIQQQIAGPLAQGLTSFATQSIGSMFGGSTAGTTTANIQGFSGSGLQGGVSGATMLGPPAANGGNVFSNKAHLVGERGPELFVPGQDGRIIPNTEMGGGGDVTVNIINQGGEQLEAQQQQTRRGPNGEQTVDVMVKSSMERLDSQGQLDGIFRRHGARRQGQF